MGKKKTAASRKKGKEVKVLAPTQDDAMDAGELLPKKVYLPGMAMPSEADGEWELEADMSAYVMLRGWQTAWPCLSFDMLRDAGGDERTAFPMSAMAVAGSQSGEAGQNQLMVMRLANLHRNGKEPKPLGADGRDDDDGDEDGDDDEDDEEDEEASGKKPHFAMAAVAHPGCVNRVRSHQSHPAVLTATWSDSGAVHVWALGEAHRLVQDAPSTGADKTYTLRLDPLHSQQHQAEGYALAWSSHGPQLLAGDCAAQIALYSVTSDGRVSVDGGPFVGHAGSVEDLAWSPAEATVFASCSTDGTVRLWDTRLARSAPALTHAVSSTDVNVLSWNASVGHLLASGDDAGRLCTWDLRALQQPVYASSWHADAITSVEWNREDASVLAVSGADDQVTLWDFAVAPDDQEPAVVEGREVPAQLLFVHQGQQHVKEVHWHPQLAGVLVSTAASGFNVFKTVSV